MTIFKSYPFPSAPLRGFGAKRVGNLILLAGLFEVSRLSRFESGIFVQFGSIQASALYVADVLYVIGDIVLFMAGAMLLNTLFPASHATFSRQCDDRTKTCCGTGGLWSRSLGPGWWAIAILVFSSVSRSLLSAHYSHIGFAQIVLAIGKLSATVLLCAGLLKTAPGRLLRAMSRWWPLAFTLFVYLQMFFHPLPIAALNQATVGLVHWLLVHLEGVSAVSMQALPNGTWIRLGAFQVDILPVCSGYEGLFLFSGLYLSYALIARQRPGLAMALIWLAGLAAVFCLNALRIVALLELGARVAPQGAIYGFHSRFGILSVLAVACGAIFVLERACSSNATRDGGQRLVSRVAPGSAEEDAVRAALRDCLPLAAVVTLNLAFGIYRTDINWGYPLIVAITLGVLWHTHRHEWRAGNSRLWLPVLAGSAVYGVWLHLVPPDPARSLVMESALSAASGALAGGWIAVRFLGSALVTPVVEELAFRRGLWRLAEDTLARRVPTGTVPAGVLLITSGCFAAMHSQPVAAFVAALAYGGVRLSRLGLPGAIAAHGVTNAMLGLHVIATGQWSYW
ncbi:CAAX prenyl protease-related protein [Sphingobium sp. B2]|uniref:CAAX prenyl protease-related protein n=1 Tax=Sphingobium sp. B2 TaxID=2583228 RepID=UPI0011A87B18|nr:CAAX prenyl protease-related protein [Sphingobium sp. B2]